MGYRLHYAKKYEVEWDGGFFNWKVEEWDDLVRNEFESYWSNGQDYADATEWEIDAEEWEDYLTKLKTLPQDKENEYMTEYTNKDVLEAMTEMYNDRDKNINQIRLCWF